MTIALDFGTLFMVASAFVAALWAVVQIINRLQTRQLETRFDALAASISTLNSLVLTGQEATQRLEREFLHFKAEVSRDYVRREDFIRAVGTIEAKIDNMALRVERAMFMNINGSAA